MKLKIMKALWVLFLFGFPVLTQAQFTYTTNNGSIAITGFTGNQTTLNIPSSTNGYPVTSIGTDAFDNDNCPSLTSMTIPNSVTNIGIDAFMYCYTLTNITVAADNPAYSSVGGVLFDVNQANLIQFPASLSGSYSIPNTVTNIISDSFHGCVGLTSVTIPDSVTSIGSGAFEGCNYLTSVTIPNGIISIGALTFASCGLTNVVIGSGITNIDGLAFFGCYFLTSVTFGCPNVLPWFNGSQEANVILLNTVTNIGSFAFFGAHLTSVTIPDSVTSIGSGAFAGCPHLSGIYFQGNSPPLTNDQSVFSDGTKGIVYYLPGTTGWGPTFDGLPTVLWNPQAQTEDGSFGVQANQFGFNITGSRNLALVVEGSTDLVNWSPVSTNTLNTFIGTNGTSYFSDPKWTNFPGRFYRLRSP